jgi:hypothetical protein
MIAVSPIRSQKEPQKGAKGATKEEAGPAPAIAFFLLSLFFFALFAPFCG